MGICICPKVRSKRSSTYEDSQSIKLTLVSKRVRMVFLSVLSVIIQVSNKALKVMPFAVITEFRQITLICFDEAVILRTVVKLGSNDAFITAMYLIIQKFRRFIRQKVQQTVYVGQAVNGG